MARVVVNVTARDLTGPQLARMRRSFRNLGNDLNRFAGNQTRGNFNRLNQALRDSEERMRALRGNIPDDEFRRLSDAMGRAQRQMARGFGRADLGSLQRDIDTIRTRFRDLDDNARIRVRIDPDPDINGNRYRTRLTRTLTSPTRLVGRSMGGILSDGIGQGIISGFKGAGPVAAAVFAGAILAALAFLGAAIAGILITALGAAFVGIGAFSAAKSQEVKERWSQTLDSLKENFAEVGEPMIPVLDRALSRLEKMGDIAAPKLKKAIADTIPFTEQFIRSFENGFARFAGNAFQPIMDAWAAFGPIFAKEFEDFMGELGDSVKEMANLVREHPEEIRLAIRGVFELIDLLVDSITFLGKVWVFMAQNAGDAFGFILKGMRYLTIAINEFLFAILDGATQAFGWVPGLGGKLKKSRNEFRNWKDNVALALEQAADAAFGWDDALNQANRKRKLEVDIESWKVKLARARSDLKRTSNQKARAKLQADISDLERKIARAKGKLASINGQVARSYVYTTYTDVYTSLDQRKRRHGLAHGGIAGLGRAATGGARNNMTLVGEQGPEIVNLAPGSHVRSNPDTRRFLREQSRRQGGGGVGTIEIVSSDAFLIEYLRKAIRVRGGDVNVVLSTGRRAGR